MEDLADILRSRLERQGMKPSELERKANLSRGMISQLLDGKKSSIASSHLPHIAKALQTTVAALFGEEDEMPRLAAIDRLGLEGELLATVNLLAPMVKQPMLCELSRSYDREQLAKGDRLIVDEGAEVAEGKLAIARRSDMESGAPELRLGRVYGGQLAMADDPADRIAVGAGAYFEIAGPVVAVWRAVA